MRKPIRHALTADKVRFVGDPVAMVVARTVQQARDAAEAVSLDIDILPAVKFVMARRQNSPPDSPRYFLKAIAEYHHNRTAGLPEIVIDQHRQETIHVAAQPARPTFDRFAAEDARRERGRRHLASMVGPVGPRDGAADGGYD